LKPGRVTPTSRHAQYGTDDLRNILERSSARKHGDARRCRSLCRCLLKTCGIRVLSHVAILGGITAELPRTPDWDEVERTAEASAVRVADSQAEAKIIAAIDEAGAQGDTLGGVLRVVATGCPPGLGSHVSWERRLDSRLAAALMGIQAIKGVEVGMGSAWRTVQGSAVHDEIFHDTSTGFSRSTNNAGGLEGGMTNGEPIVVRAAMKPLSTLKKPLRSVNMESKAAVQAHFERSDVCAVPAGGGYW